MSASLLLATARLANCHRRVTVDLLRTRTALIEDTAMFAKLEALASEFETEADGFIKDHLSGLATIEQRFVGVLNKLKGARADMAKTATDAGTVVQDVKVDVSDVLSLETTAAASINAVELMVKGAGEPAVGSLVSGDAGIAVGTIVSSIDADLGRLGLSLPTIAEIAAGATITVTPKGA